MNSCVLLFKTLADETRLRILSILVQGELCVCDIVKILDMGQSKISRHLAHLRNAGLVSDRRDGVWMYYSLGKAGGLMHRRIVEWLAEAQREIPQTATDLQTLDAMRERGELCNQRHPNDQGRILPSSVKTKA